MKIRPYQTTDYTMIERWCREAGITTLTRDTLPWSTFVAEYDEIPMASLSLILSNAKEYAYLEYAIGNPAANREIRRESFRSLVSYIERAAKQMGYKHLVCHAPNEKLSSYYTSFGYQPNLKGVTTMVKELA